MELIAISVLVVIALWALVALGKILQRLSAIGRTLEEIKAVLQDAPPSNRRNSSISS